MLLLQAADASAPTTVFFVLGFPWSPSRGWGGWVQPCATSQVGGRAGLRMCVAANVPPGHKNTTPHAVPTWVGSTVLKKGVTTHMCICYTQCTVRHCLPVS